MQTALYIPSLIADIEGLQAALDANADAAQAAADAAASKLTQAAADLLYKAIDWVPAWNDITDLPTTLAGFGITNAYTTTQADALLAGKADLVGGFVPSSQLPSFVDDVLEYANFAALPVTGESGKIYVTLDTNITYRWSGSAYTEISASLALGETSATAYRGDRGKIAYDHTLLTNNPHSVTKSQVGLGNVENTAISTYAGSPNINTLGTVGTGVWQGTPVADAYIASAATWNAKQAALGYTPVNRAGDTMSGDLGITKSSVKANTIYTNPNGAYASGAEYDGVNRYLIRPITAYVPVLTVAQQDSGTARGAFFEFFGRGNPSAADAEALRFILNNAYGVSGTTDAVIDTYKAGSGTLRPIRLRPGGTDALILDTNGQVRVPHLGSATNDSTQAAIFGKPSSAPLANYQFLRQEPYNSTTANFSVDGAGVLTAAGGTLTGALRVNAKIGIDCTPTYALDIQPTYADFPNGGSVRIGNGTVDNRLRVEGTQPYMIGMKQGANSYVWMGATSGGGYQFSNVNGDALLTISQNGNAIMAGQVRSSHLGSATNDSTQAAALYKPSAAPLANYQAIRVEGYASTNPLLTVDSLGKLAIYSGGNETASLSVNANSATLVLGGIQGGVIKTVSGDYDITIIAGNDYNSHYLNVKGSLSLNPTLYGYGTASSYCFDSNRGVHSITGGAATNPTWYANRFGVVTVNGYTAAQVVTDVATVRIDGAPVAGTNATLTNRYALWVAGGTSLFGGQIRAASLGVGNSAAATTPGTVTKKIEVFDAAGASLGFIAVYSSIT